MEKKDILIKNIMNNLYKDKSSNFLDNNELKIVTSALNKEKINYNIYFPYKDADKVILYAYNIPQISVLEIKTKNILKHSDILGSLFNEGIDMSLIGDIIIDNGYYIIAKPSICDYLKYNIYNIGKYSVNIVDANYDLDNYERKYEEIELLVPSLRMDIIVSKITHISRNKIEELFNKKEVILNYEILIKYKELKENDIFSIRKYGKYKYIGVKKNTKNNLIILLKKYI